MEYGSDIGDIAGMLTDATSKDLERLRGSFDTFEKHISDGLRDMGYDEEVIASFLAEAEVATEVLCELAIRPDEAGVEEMPPVAPRPARSPAGYPTAASTTTIRILRTPAPLVDMPSPSRDIVEPAPRTRAGIGIRMTAGHVKER